MEIKMKLPYKELHSEHLESLVTIIRIFTILGYLGLGLSLVSFVLSFFSIKFTHPSLIFISFSVLLISGLFAILVSFEESYRVKSNRLVSEKDNDI
jgi:hypothetical protein